MGARNSTTRKAVKYSASGAIESCVFCNIVSGVDPQATSILTKNSTVSAFHPRHPSASGHILVVPNHHVQHIHSMEPGPASVLLLQQMKQMGMECARQQVPNIQEDECHLLFHAPPFNSVDHLHLHVHIPPYTTFWKSLTFTPGWPWCTSFETVLASMGGDDSTSSKL
jgi:diadenosine tetraphosphate (Ap4A) HIT family hydrolase